ncbi:MAG: transporter [Phycisphaerae bacterium]|nr:transporter [Phycisphaerae bacterium]
MSKPLHPIEASALQARRERVFLLISGLFLGTLTMLNILGVTRFIKLAEIDRADGAGTLVFAVAVGVLPYPLTFLCTDLICELYGKARANAVVWVGLLLNAWVIFILWLGGALPGFEQLDQQGLVMRDQAGREPLFFEIRTLAFAAVFASMAAYFLAQFCDVWLYHFWKQLTRGRMLWLRNNASTLVSQMVDTAAVILITWQVGGLVGVLDPAQPAGGQILLLILTGYAFKAACGLLDTIPLYLLVGWLSRYLQIERSHRKRMLEDPGGGVPSGR